MSQFSGMTIIGFIARVITWVQRLSDNKFSKPCSVSDRLSPQKKKSQKSVMSTSENLGSKKSYIFLWHPFPSLLITDNKWKIWAKHLNARKRLLSQQVVKLSQQVNGRNSSSMQTVQVDRMGMLSSGKMVLIIDYFIYDHRTSPVLIWSIDFFIILIIMQ